MRSNETRPKKVPHLTLNVWLQMVTAFAGMISWLSYCFFLCFHFSCVPAVPVVNASTKNAACIFYNYTVENGICKNSLTSLYVFGDSGTLQHGEDEIAKMERFFREVQSFEISEMCKPIMIDLFCRYHFPPCDTSLDRPHARRICRKSCANLVHGLCEKEIVFFREAIAAVPGLLDENILNCTLYDIANGGDVPECYQYHTVPGQYWGGELNKSFIRGDSSPTTLCSSLQGATSRELVYLLTMNKLTLFLIFLSVYN